MSVTVTLLVLLATTFHALWNALGKKVQIRAGIDHRDSAELGFICGHVVSLRWMSGAHGLELDRGLHIDTHHLYGDAQPGLPL